MDFWRKTSLMVATSGSAILLYVVESEGSSPGRAGFRMCVTIEDMTGSIGGGIMEHKLVEFARSLLKKSPFQPFLKLQIHRGKEGENRSGMICSGQQTVAFCFIRDADLSWLRQLAKQSSGLLEILPTGIHFTPDTCDQTERTFIWLTDNDWHYREPIKGSGVVYIIGGGHVGLACSALLRTLGFYLILLDNRGDLNTFVSNTHVHEKRVIDFNEVDQVVNDGDDRYVVLVSFGYRTDALVIRRLSGKRFRYFGVMGSSEKMKTLLKELRDEGYPEDYLNSLYTPIGIPIYSKTPEEIAVSIAAEIIRIKNAPAA